MVKNSATGDRQTNCMPPQMIIILSPDKGGNSNQPGMHSSGCRSGLTKGRLSATFKMV